MRASVAATPRPLHRTFTPPRPRSATLPRMIRPTALDQAPRGTRTRRIVASVALLTAAAPLAGCGGSTAPSGDAAGHLSARPASPAVLRQPAAPATAGALALVPDDAAAQTRLAYADAKRLRATDLPLPAATVTTAVLGDDARSAAIAVGSARKPFRPGAKPETSAITPAAQSAVQSCLGDALAQTILGPATMGNDAALGAGLAVSASEPQGAVVRICAAPQYVRHLGQSERALERRFVGVRGAAVEHEEIGERAIVRAVVPARRLDARAVRAIVSGGSALRALAPWR